MSHGKVGTGKKLGEIAITDDLKIVIEDDGWNDNDIMLSIVEGGVKREFTTDRFPIPARDDGRGDESIMNDLEEINNTNNDTIFGIGDN